MKQSIKDYIILDGRQGYIEGNYLYWNITPNYFKNWQRGDDVLVKLIDCQFIATGATVNSGQLTALIECSINAENHTNTNETTLLAIQPITYLTTDQAITNNASLSNTIQIKTNRFSRIGIAISYNNEYASLSAADYLFNAILEVEYYNSQDETKNL